MVGREGCVGFPLAVGIDVPSVTAFQQISGRGLRIAAAEFRALLDELPTLRRSVNSHAGFAMMQAMQNTACNRSHAADPRCAKWLLLSADRTGRSDLELTHEFLSQMLGTTRPSVTITLQRLEASGAIEHTRGVVRVRDRQRLQRHACECYEAIASAYLAFERTLGPEHDTKP